MPQALSSVDAPALLIALHGHGSCGEDFRAAGFDAYAERLGFVVVYPDGIEGAWEFQGQNKGPHDDLGFLRVLIDSLIEAFGIDQNNVFVTGHSMGGFMAYRVATELSDRIAAVAPVAGLYVPGKTPLQKSVKKPLGILHIHAEDDEIVPIDGYPGYAMSARQSLKEWAKAVGSLEEPSIATTAAGLVRLRWSQGKAPVQAIFYPGGGHSWQASMTDAIMEFFSSVEEPEVAIEAPFDQLPATVVGRATVNLQPRIQGIELVQRLDLFDGNRLLDRSSQAPFPLAFQTEPLHRYDLHLVVVLKDGRSKPVPSVKTVLALPPNLSSFAQAHASSSESEAFMPEKAIDSDPFTRWSSESEDDQTLTLEFPTRHRVSAVSILWEIAHAQRYGVQVSLDGAHWRTVHREEDGKGGAEVIQFPPEELRYLRLQFEKRATVWGYSLWEIQVHE